MAAANAFETWVRATLEHYGLEADDLDLAVIGIAEQVYGPQRDALMAADLSGLAPEHGLDPSHSPLEEDGR